MRRANSGEAPSTAGAIPPPAVPATVYDESYYKHSCIGSDEWRESCGRRMAGLYPGVLHRSGLAEGECLVDVGTGRGELLVAAAARGASAIGIEYSPAAVELARRTIAAHGSPERAEIVLADARALPLPDGQADLVTMLDVIEHLTRTEQLRALEEAHRVLRPGGRILIHTFPNRLIYTVTYRLQRILSPRRRRNWPRDPRNELEHRMHVGEQSAGSLRSVLRDAGFSEVKVTHGQMIYVDFVPDGRSRKTYHRLAARRITAPFGSGDLWAQAVRSGGQKDPASADG